MTRATIPDCPQCRGTNVTTLNHGRKSAVMLGGLAGGICSAATVWQGARIGAMMGTPTGPAGALLSAVAGAVLAALAGAATGCAAGGVVGDLIDNKVLNNYRCVSCGHRFSRASATPVEPLPDVPQTHPRSEEFQPGHPMFFPHRGHGPHWPPDDPDEEQPYGFYRSHPHSYHPAYPG